MITDVPRVALERGIGRGKAAGGFGKGREACPGADPGSKNRQEALVTAPYFVVDMFEIKDPQLLSTRDHLGKTSAQILVAVEGCGTVQAGNSDPITVTKGDAIVVPADLENFSVRPQWALEFLRARVPGEALSEPEIRM